MSKSDGTVTGAPRALINHGDDKSHYVLAILGDGFTAAEQTAYQQRVDAIVAEMRVTPPYSDNWDLINIYRIDVVSNESGADNLCGMDNLSAVSRDTFFDSDLCGYGPRGLDFDVGLIAATLGEHVKEADSALLLVNSPVWAGQTFRYLYAGITMGVGTKEVMHEISHLFGLGDEYCDDSQLRANDHPRSEPVEKNVTVTTDRSLLKWRHLVRDDTPLPTLANPDCSRCHRPASSGFPDGTVGLFEGAGGYRCKAYRPEFNCRMRQSKREKFCAVCTAAITEGLLAGTAVISQPAPGICLALLLAYEGYRAHPDLAVLQAWRERRLAPGARGRVIAQALLTVHERTGPTLNRLLRDRPWLARAIRRLLLAPLARRLRRSASRRPAGARLAIQAAPARGCGCAAPD